MNTENDVLLIVKKGKNVFEAKEKAEQEFNAFFTQWYGSVTGVRHSILRELYTDEGKVGYIIRVEVEADEQTFVMIKRWAHEHMRSEK